MGFYSERNKFFIKDKNQFFTQIRKEPNQDKKIARAEQLAAEKNYDFLLKNHDSLESECRHLYAVLKNKKSEENAVFLAYCYYLAHLLEIFYRAYSHAQEEEYKRLKELIKAYLLGEKKKAEEQIFIKFLEESLIKSIQRLINAPFHTSTLRDYVGFLNICRVYWVFCRLTLINMLLLAKEVQVIDLLNSALGMHTEIDKVISILQAPNGVLNYFSVGLFLARFLIDAGLLIRHTFFPGVNEKSTTRKRFNYEVKKRHCRSINDAMWFIVNFITNYNMITLIPAPVANVITAAFLGGDFGMFLYKRHLAQQAYLFKKAQYLQEINYYARAHLSAEERLKHIRLLQNQLSELEIEWQTTEASLIFGSAAAVLFVSGFTVAFIFMTTAIMLVSYFVCILGAAMYLTMDAYSKFTEASLRLKQTELTEKNSAFALKEYEAARNDFIFTLAKNTFIPTFFIATYIICWPAAVALTVVYIGFEFFHSYNQHSSAEEAKKLEAITPPESEEVISESFLPSAY